jgi:hypothetical protein
MWEKDERKVRLLEKIAKTVDALYMDQSYMKTYWEGSMFNRDIGGAK